MKQHILLVILICFSLGLAGVLWYSSDVGTRRKKAADELEQWQRKNPNRYVAFKANAANFYRRSSKTASEERRRLRTLHYQLQNDPDREHLTQTMERYVEWVQNIGNPTTMRELQEKPLAERVAAIQEMIRQENQNDSVNERSMIDVASLQKMLPPELQDADVARLCRRFDEWLATKYNEAIAKLSEEQRSYLPLFRAFYRDLFELQEENGLTLNVQKKETPPDIIEKMALISLLYRFSNEPGIMDFLGTWMMRFCEEEQDKLLNPEQNILEENVCRFLARSGRNRQGQLQYLLLIGIIRYYTEHYTKIPPNHAETLLLRGNPQKLIQLYGAYLASLHPQRRDEILRATPEFAVNRIRGDLLSGTFFFMRGGRGFSGGRNGRYFPFFMRNMLPSGGGRNPGQNDAIRPNFSDDSMRQSPDIPPISPSNPPPMW
ncbi:MAG: hypothetical protein LBT05_07665 [Planctomycetaceae bacterium]|jgi:hypothetical protein|nr:hypothetical protein [Planctomycetaceae bacterium]